MKSMITSWSLFSVTLLVLGAAWIVLSTPLPGATTGGKIPAPRQGFLAPDFELQDGQGNAVRLSDLRGQPVLVNFWASWCPPCQAEMPAMQAAHERYAEEGFVILAVNVTAQDSEAAAMDFIASRGLTFQVLLDRNGEASRLYETRALPTSFFIDSQGIIQEVVVGGPMTEALLRTEAEGLLQEAR